MLGRLYQSLAGFSKLTDSLRALVDERLAIHLQVTGWQDGVLRVTLDRPVLLTRWRFQEPAVRQRLAAAHHELAGLREIRVVVVTPPGTDRPAPASRLGDAPGDSLAALADGETHEALRQALQRLAEAARRARG